MNDLRDKLLKMLHQDNQTPEEKELRIWMKLNALLFLGQAWTPHEVAEIALMNGFTEYTVYGVLSHWEAALAGKNIDNMALMQEIAFDGAVESFYKLQAKAEYVAELDLSILWKDYLRYSLEGKDFDD